MKFVTEENELLVLEDDNIVAREELSLYDIQSYFLLLIDECEYKEQELSISEYIESIIEDSITLSVELSDEEKKELSSLIEEQYGSIIDAGLNSALQIIHNRKQ